MFLEDDNSIAALSAGGFSFVTAILLVLTGLPEAEEKWIWVNEAPGPEEISASGLFFWLFFKRGVENRRGICYYFLE